MNLKEYVSKIKNYIYWKKIEMGFYDEMDDETFLKMAYKRKFGKALNLNNPITFTEKIQWLKLYDRNPKYTVMVDKYEVKKYVADIIGEDYIIPTLGVWNNFDEIDFGVLPEKFVLKCTHDSGGIVVVKDKSKLDKKNAKKKIEKSLQRNYYYVGREWPYKNVKPRIIAEEYMEDEKTSELRDYKFFTFDGVVKVLYVATERGRREETKFDFFDMNYKHLPLVSCHPNASVMPEKPIHFEEMKILAERLSKGISHLRVDFYEVNGKIYFGELTFSYMSGMTPFEPDEWDVILGSWIKLPEKNNVES